MLYFYCLRNQQRPFPVHQAHTGIDERLPGRYNGVSKLLQLVVQNENALILLLSEEAKEVFEKFRKAQDELFGINECDAFMLGFHLGGRFMLEVMEDMKPPFIDE